MNLDHFEKKVKEAIEATTYEIERLKTASKPISPDNAIGRLTRMEAINAKSVSEANLNSAKLKLKMLHGALKRIADESYGECLSCGEEIAEKRLNAVPESTLCISCAQKREV